LDWQQAGAEVIAEKTMGKKCISPDGNHHHVAGQGMEGKLWPE